MSESLFSSMGSRFFLHSMACCFQSLAAKRCNVPFPILLMRKCCINSLEERHIMRWSARNSVSIRTLARKRNIFLEPGQVDKELTVSTIVAYSLVQIHECILLSGMYCEPSCMGGIHLRIE